MKSEAEAPTWRLLDVAEVGARGLAKNGEMTSGGRLMLRAAGSTGGRSARFSIAFAACEGLPLSGGLEHGTRSFDTAVPSDQSHLPFEGHGPEGSEP